MRGFFVALFGLVASELSGQTNQAASHLNRTQTLFQITPESDRGVFSTATAVDGRHVEIPRHLLPNARDQQYTPTCQTFCVAALIEYHICAIFGRKDCSSTPPDERLSLLSVLAYNHNSENELKLSIGYLSQSYVSTVPIMNSVSEAVAQRFGSEGCAPYEKIVASQRNSEALNAEYDRVKEHFNRAKASVRERPTTGEIEACSSCQTLRRAVNDTYFTELDDSAIARGLRNRDDNSFGRFFWNTVFDYQARTSSKCKKIELDISANERVRANYFPEKPNTKLDSVFKLAEQLIRQRMPVILGSVCGLESGSGTSRKCLAKHCLVIVGFKTISDPKSGTIELVRVLNSWGEAWQDRNNDGWIRLDALKELVTTADDPDAARPASTRRNAFAYTITWFEPQRPY